MRQLFRAITWWWSERRDAAEFAFWVKSPDHCECCGIHRDDLDTEADYAIWWRDGALVMCQTCNMDIGSCCQAAAAGWKDTMTWRQIRKEAQQWSAHE